MLSMNNLSHFCKRSKVGGEEPVSSFEYFLYILTINTTEFRLIYHIDM